MSDDVAERLDAVERALTGSDADLPSLAADAELVDRVGAAEERLDAVEERIEELDAAIQAVRGYVGNVESVNEDVERRANAAVAGVEALEERVADLESGDRTDYRATAEPRTRGGPSDDPGGETASQDRVRGDDSQDDAEGDRGVVARLREAL